MLIDDAARKSFASARSHPAIPPPTSEAAARAFLGAPSGIAPDGLAPLQTWALKLIGDRFDLQTVARGSSGSRSCGWYLGAEHTF